MIKRITGICGAVLLPLALSGTAGAAGFYVPQKGSVGVGLATAGGAARTEDGSTVFFNPAAMTKFKNSIVQGGFDVLFPSVKIDNTGSNAATPGTAGAALPYSGSNGDAGSAVFIPNIYYIRPTRNQDLWFGLAVTSPFGLSLDYDSDWFGRYDSIHSELITVDIAPSISYRINERWSIGGGIDIQYADAKLTNAMPNTLNPGGPTPGTDGRARLTGDDWSAGFNIGVLLTAGPRTNVGLHYRSEIKHTLEGKASITGLGGPLSPANGDFNASTDLDLPAIASLGITHDATNDLRLFGEIQWFGWSSFDEIRTKLGAGLPDAVRPQNFRDTYSAAIGAQYTVNGQWTVRGGVRFDQTPTVDGFRNTSIPDSGLTWVGLGATYKYQKGLIFDFGFVNAFFEGADIDLTQTFYTGTPARGVVNTRGQTDNNVSTLSFSLTYEF